MRAFFIRRYGGREVFEAGELPPPALGPRDVRIAVHAASVNPVDWKIRQGKTKVLLPYRFPLVLGNDCSGVVREVGSEVKAFKPGDAVYSRLFKCTRRLIEMPKLWNYTRELYRRPGIASTVRHDEILRHYYRSFPALNPHGIVPLLDPPDFAQ